MRAKLRATLLGVCLFSASVWPASPGLGSHYPTNAGEGASSPPAPAPPAGQQLPPAPPAPKDPEAQCLHDNMNGARAAEGLLPLPESPALLNVAQKHSDLMASAESLYHSSSEVFQLLPAGWRAYGENVVKGTECHKMFEALMNSESHRAALLRADFNHSGTAISHGSDGWIYATMAFADLPPLPASPPAPAAAVPPAASVPAVPAPVPAAPPAAGPEQALAVAPPATISLGLPATGAYELSAGEEGGLLQAARAAIGAAAREASAEGVPQQKSSARPGAGGSALFDIFEKEPGFASGHSAAAAEMVFELDRSSRRPAPRPSGMS